jgi:hypothetical protein
MKNESSPPLLFLDVDGVLNTRPGSLDRDKLDLVRWIVAQTGCRIVLSSSWRLVERQRARICAELPIWRVTPEIGTWERGKEVRAFLDGNPEVQRFAILDDYAHGWEHSIRPYLVLTDGRVGLHSLLAAAAAQILGWSWGSPALQTSTN